MIKKSTLFFSLIFATYEANAIPPCPHHAQHPMHHYIDHPTCVHHCVMIDANYACVPTPTHHNANRNLCCVHTPPS
jgi:hypothetical protein